MAVASGGMEGRSNDQLKTISTRFGSAVTGCLSEDFLRITEQKNVKPKDVCAESAYNGPPFDAGQGGILTVTLVQAKLAKNYGMTRMDPYCRMKVGMQVFETPTAYNGSKTPRWNKLIQCHIPESLREIYIEIFDECSFSGDERVGWGLIHIPESVFSGNPVEDWYVLSGKQGEGKEGKIHVVFQFQKFGGMINSDPRLLGQMMGTPYNGGIGVQPLYGYPSFFTPAMPAEKTNQQISPEMIPSQRQNMHQVVQETTNSDLKTLKEMCPDIDEDIVASVLQQCGGSLDKAAEQLLEMSAP